MFKESWEKIENFERISSVDNFKETKNKNQNKKFSKCIDKILKGRRTLMNLNWIIERIKKENNELSIAVSEQSFWEKIKNKDNREKIFDENIFMPFFMSMMMASIIGYAVVFINEWSLSVYTAMAITFFITCISYIASLKMSLQKMKRDYLDNEEEIAKKEQYIEEEEKEVEKILRKVAKLLGRDTLDIKELIFLNFKTSSLSTNEKIKEIIERHSQKKRSILKPWRESKFTDTDWCSDKKNNESNNYQKMEKELLLMISKEENNLEKVA